MEGAYSFVLISILDPESMYIVKNTGTMVIGVAKQLHAVDEEEVKTIDKNLENSSPNRRILSD